MLLQPGHNLWNLTPWLLGQMTNLQENNLLPKFLLNKMTWGGASSLRVLHTNGVGNNAK